jgi:hypothetical protein
MVELGTRCTTERVPVGNSPPKVARTAFLPVGTAGESSQWGEVRGGAGGWARVKSGFIFPILACLSRQRSPHAAAGRRALRHSHAGAPPG